VLRQGIFFEHVTGHSGEEQGTGRKGEDIFSGWILQGTPDRFFYEIPALSVSQVPCHTGKGIVRARGCR